jgi:CBS domain containing-hemolysin-like protein
VAPFVRLIMIVFTPLRVVLLQISRGVLATLGFRADLEVPAVHQDDFARMVEESHKGGMIEALERDFIQNLLNFGEVRIGQIMVPRPEIFSLPHDLPIERLIHEVKRSRFSRVPIYQDKPGNILGVLHAKVLLDQCPGKGCVPGTIGNLLHPAYYVPENKHAFDLLTELQTRHLRLALVVDEYGTLVGLVTMEDILEELFGEIAQEFKVEEKFLEEAGPGVWRVKASMSLADFNEALGLELPAQEFDTIGGLVLNLFGELPLEGDRVSYQDLQFKVARRKGTRILELEVRRRLP